MCAYFYCYAVMLCNAFTLNNARTRIFIVHPLFYYSIFNNQYYFPSVSDRWFNRIALQCAFCLQFVTFCYFLDKNKRKV